MSTVKVRFPISAKLALFTGSLTLACALALGLWLMEISRDTLTTAGRDYRLAVAEDIAESIRAETVSAETTLFTAAELLSEPRLDQVAKLAIVLSYVGTSKSLDHVHVYDARGGFIDTIRAPDYTPPLPPDITANMRESLASGEGVLVMGTTVADVPRTTIITTIRAAGQVTGYVATAAKMEGVARRLKALSAERLPASSATVWVVDRDATVIAVSDDAKASLGDSLKTHPLFKELGVRLQKRIATSAELTVNGEEIVSSLLPLPDLGWAVAVEVPTEVAYAAVASMRRSIWIAVLVFLALAVVLSVVGARRITGPLSRLAEFSRHLAARDFDKRADVESADEVGLLANVLNGAAEDLKASEAAIRRETRIRADLGRYLPHELVDAVVAERQDLELGGVRAPMTILFADVVRFTPMCEQLEPEEVVALLNELFTIVTEIIFRHGGTVDKFIGDGIMAFWGAPESCPDQADCALQAADEILSWLDVGNESWKTKYGVQLELAIGVNTGEPIVGNIGSSTRMEYTAIGEAVNIAARLEALARPNQVLTTSSTRAASEMFDFAKVSDEVVSAGGQPIEIWEVLL